ncbi:MAG TPA: efflux RND transporter periplasmic adaptor subunit [Bacteroidia bacterium]|jgi:membrane fusion protein (multidrug efflux system)|nr:efflux RND transporter periplasmic adaptor subunit [Bacteroidia bacterium]
MRKKFQITACIFSASTAFLFLTSCGSNDDKTQTKSADAPVSVSGIVVSRQHAEDDIRVPGTLLPMDEVELAPEVSGRVTFLYLPEGQAVKKGTLLVKLFDEDLQAQLVKLQEQLKTAQSTADRQKKLLDANGISQMEYDQTVTTVNTLNADIKDMNAQIMKTEIRAPFDGVIGLRNISEGAYLSTGTSVASFRATQKMKIDFNVPEIYASLLTKGKNISFIVDGDTTNYHADVIATENNIGGEALDLRVRGLIKESSTRLIPGASASVSLGLGANDSALLVPTQSLIAKGSTYSLIVSKNGKAQITKVQTGIRTATQVEITSGINAGDTIATTGLQFIKQGTQLRFTNLK